MILLLCVMNDQGCDGSTLVILCVYGVFIVGAAQFTMHRMPPGENWRGFSTAFDLPECSSVASDGLGTSLTFVDGGGN